MMFILGEADYRTPPTSGGEQMFRALKFMHKPTVMVRFPGRVARTVALRSALASHRASGKYRRLVRHVPDGNSESRIQHAAGGNVS